MTEDKLEYWDNYYKSSQSQPLHPKVPSQFAAFVAQELNRNFSIVDVGCGNGRDSAFFASLGFDVLGLDSSHSAVELCRQSIGHLKDKLSYQCCSVSDQSFDRLIIGNLNHRELAIYSRFFLHAITEDEERIFLTTIKNIEQVSVIALEFRTDRDLSQPKETSDHYRRFIAPSDFAQRAHALGFKICYFAEGFGFAKYRNDDAHVARFLLHRQVSN